MQMLRTLPFLALVPLFILWFGIGEAPKVALVALGSTLSRSTSTCSPGSAASIRSCWRRGASSGSTARADPPRRPAGRAAVRAGRAALRLGVAWLSLVVAEQINASAGIGYMINDARDFLRTDVIVVGLAVYALLGLRRDALVRLAERRLLAWRPTLVRRMTVRRGGGRAASAA